MYVVENAQNVPVNIADVIDPIEVEFVTMAPKAVMPGDDPTISFMATDAPFTLLDVKGSPPMVEFPATETPSWATKFKVTNRPTRVYLA